MVCLNRNHCLQAINIPPNFKKAKSESVQNVANRLTEAPFFIRWACPIYNHIKTEIKYKLSNQRIAL